MIEATLDSVHDGLPRAQIDSNTTIRNPGSRYDVFSGVNISEGVNIRLDRYCINSTKRDPIVPGDVLEWLVTRSNGLCRGGRPYGWVPLNSRLRLTSHGDQPRRRKTRQGRKRRMSLKYREMKEPNGLKTVLRYL